jgi:hypothetical protein
VVRPRLGLGFGSRRGTPGTEANRHGPGSVRSEHHRPNMTARARRARRRTGPSWPRRSSPLPPHSRRYPFAAEPHIPRWRVTVEDGELRPPAGLSPASRVTPQSRAVSPSEGPAPCLIRRRLPRLWSGFASSSVGRARRPRRHRSRPRESTRLLRRRRCTGRPRISRAARARRRMSRKTTSRSPSARPDAKYEPGWKPARASDWPVTQEFPPFGVGRSAHQRRSLK